MIEEKYKNELLVHSSKQFVNLPKPRGVVKPPIKREFTKSDDEDSTSSHPYRKVDTKGYHRSAMKAQTPLRIEDPDSILEKEFHRFTYNKDLYSQLYRQDDDQVDEIEEEIAEEIAGTGGTQDSGFINEDDDYDKSGSYLNIKDGPQQKQHLSVSQYKTPEGQTLIKSQQLDDPYTYFSRKSAKGKNTRNMADRLAIQTSTIEKEGSLQ